MEIKTLFDARGLVVVQVGAQFKDGCGVITKIEQHETNVWYRIWSGEKVVADVNKNHVMIATFEEA